MATCVDAKNIICKHVRSSLTYYVDLTDRLGDGTVVAVLDLVADDVLLTLSGEAVISTEGDFPGPCGTDVTIEAGKGILFTATGGTTGSRATITVEFEKDNGDVDAVQLLMDVYGTE